MFNKPAPKRTVMLTGEDLEAGARIAEHQLALIEKMRAAKEEHQRAVTEAQEAFKAAVQPDFDLIEKSVGTPNLELDLSYYREHRQIFVQVYEDQPEESRVQLPTSLVAGGAKVH